MSWTPTTFTAVALAAALALPGVARAGYVSQTYNLDQPLHHTAGVNYGTVTVEAYDGKGTAAGGLQAGQVRFTVTADPAAFVTSISHLQGIEQFGFNTDLTLSRAQIVTPASMPGVYRNQAMGLPTDSGGAGLGAFSVVVDALDALALPKSATILITGLGTNATLNHFVLPASGGTAAFATEMDSAAANGEFPSTFVGAGIGGHVASVPAPPALLLGLIGAGAALLGRVGRFRRR